MGHPLLSMVLAWIVHPYDRNLPTIETTQMTLQRENAEFVIGGLNPAAAHAALMGSKYIRWWVILTWLRE